MYGDGRSATPRPVVQRQRWRHLENPISCKMRHLLASISFFTFVAILSSSVSLQNDIHRRRCPEKAYCRAKSDIVDW